MSTGISKNELRKVRALHQKKIRGEEGLFLAEGKKVVEEALRENIPLDAVYTTDPLFCTTHPIAVLVSEGEMKQLSTLQTPPGYLAIIRTPETQLPPALPEYIMALDGIRDPGNAGTVIRTADWFGCRLVIASEDSVEWYNPKTVQASMGSIFRMQLAHVDLVSKCQSLRDSGYAILIADMSGTSVDTFTWPDKAVIVMGSESHGASAALSKLATHRITIPGAGKAESLNVTVAAGIILSRLFQAKDLPAHRETRKEVE